MMFAGTWLNSARFLTQEKRNNMTVQELINELKKMPQEADVIMFDGPAYFTPSKVNVMTEEDGWGKKFLGKVMID